VAGTVGFLSASTAELQLRNDAPPAAELRVRKLTIILIFGSLVAPTKLDPTIRWLCRTNG
jgi:hypothetical protein